MLARIMISKKLIKIKLESDLGFVFTGKINLQELSFAV